MVKPRKTLPYTWLLKSTSENHVLYAGAICVHSSGILIAVTHTIKPDCSTFANPTVTAKTYDGGEARSVESISSEEAQSFGLSLFQLVRVTDSEVFPCYTLSDTLVVKTMSPIFSFSHHDGISFVLMSGSVCQSFNAGSPNLTMGSVLTRDNIRKLSTNDIVTKNIPRFTIIGRGLSNCLRRIDASMPLIQVQGLNETNLDGHSGWPVFTKDGNLIGLNAFSLERLQFLIPAHILKQVFDNALGQSSSVHGPPEEGEEASAAPERCFS